MTEYQPYRLESSSWLVTALRFLHRLMADCRHDNLGALETRRGEAVYHTCMDCSRLVKTDLEELPQIKPPVLTCDIDRAERAAQVRRDYEEQKAMAGPGRRRQRATKTPVETALQRLEREQREKNQSEPSWVKEAGVRL